MTEQETIFRPNGLGLADIQGLSDWQLLCAALHHAPSMKDCRDLDYGYSFDEQAGVLTCHHEGTTTSLEGDFDPADIPGSISRYYTDKEMCKTLLAHVIADKADRIAELEAVVENLPKTADGNKKDSACLRWLALIVAAICTGCFVTFALHEIPEVLQ